MNLKSLICVAMVSLCPLMQGGSKEAILKGIGSSDIESLEALLMLGSYASEQEKTLYSKCAQQKTQQAFQKLKSFGFADIKHTIKGLLNLGIAAAAGTVLYGEALQPYMKEIKPAQGKEEDNAGVRLGQYTETPAYEKYLLILRGTKQKVCKEFSDVLSDPMKYELKEAVKSGGNIILGGLKWENVSELLKPATLGFLTLYFGARGIGEFLAITRKDERYNSYLRALAVQSLIAQIPVSSLRR